MEYKILKGISSPEDVKKLNITQLEELCNEVRDCMINTVSKNGGHLASNLGTVELSVALHHCFNSPKDSILFDVGHQCYTHKLLTGRFENFSTLRTEDGISGFMRPDESEHDPFITGHSSSSLSAAYGICKAKELLGEDGYTINIVGDGAMTGGMVYEALNNAGSGRNKLIVILNDNKMSISRNVGSLARHLTVIRTKRSYHRSKKAVKSVLSAIPFIGKGIARFALKLKTMLKNAIYKSNLFEALGFQYFGPVDGHDLESLINTLEIVKSESRPAFVHIITTKGKGYSFAEADPKIYHGVSSFDINEGAHSSGVNSYSDIFGKALMRIAETDDKVCAITAAMTEGTGLYDFSKRFKNRFFDVGIAEEHATTFAAGLAIRGMKPYFAVYSTFLQRSYDQLIHDVAIAGLPVKICIDRAGIVGEDGETHQGVFDVAFLSTVPGMHIYSPCYFGELERVLERSADFAYPCAIRYPRGTEKCNAEYVVTDNDFDIFGAGDKIIVTYGRIFENARKAAEILREENINISVLKLNKIYPIEKEIVGLLKTKKEIYFSEEGIKTGGIAEQLGSLLLENGVTAKYRIIAVDNRFVPAARVADALKNFKLDTDSMVGVIKGEN